MRQNIAKYKEGQRGKCNIVFNGRFLNYYYVNMYTYLTQEIAYFSCKIIWYFKLIIKLIESHCFRPLDDDQIVNNISTWKTLKDFAFLRKI